MSVIHRASTLALAAILVATTMFSTLLQAQNVWPETGLVNDYGSSDHIYADDILPVVAYNGTNTWLALWISGRGLSTASSVDGGTSWGAKVDIPGAPILNVEIDLTFAGNNTWVAVWGSDDAFSGSAINAAKSTDNGQTWTVIGAHGIDARPRDVQVVSNGNGTVITTYITPQNAYI